MWDRKKKKDIITEGKKKKRITKKCSNSRHSWKAAPEKPGQALGKDYADAAGQLCQEKVINDWRTVAFVMRKGINLPCRLYFRVLPIKIERQTKWLRSKIFSLIFAWVVRSEYLVKMFELWKRPLLKKK